jgi:hypothetical protein
MNASYSSFSTRRRVRFGVNPLLTVFGLHGWSPGDVLAAWLTTCKRARAVFLSSEHGGGSFRLPG